MLKKIKAGAYEVISFLEKNEAENVETLISNGEIYMEWRCKGQTFKSWVIPHGVEFWGYAPFPEELE